MRLKPTNSEIKKRVSGRLRLFMGRTRTRTGPVIGKPQVLGSSLYHPPFCHHHDDNSDVAPKTRNSRDLNLGTTNGKMELSVSVLENVVVRDV